MIKSTKMVVKMSNVSVNNFFVSKNYFVNLKTIENTGFVDDKNFNNFLIQKNFDTKKFFDPVFSSV